MKMNIGTETIIQFYPALSTPFVNRESRVSKSCQSILDLSNFSLSGNAVRSYIYRTSGAKKRAKIKKN